jgi:hypothetical protein
MTEADTPRPAENLMNLIPPLGPGSMTGAGLEAARETLKLALDGAPKDTVSYRIRREMLDTLNLEHDARERLKAALRPRRSSYYA